MATWSASDISGRPPEPHANHTAPITGANNGGRLAQTDAKPFRRHRDIDPVARDAQHQQAFADAQTIEQRVGFDRAAAHHGVAVGFNCL